MRSLSVVACILTSTLVAMQAQADTTALVGPDPETAAALGSDVAEAFGQVGDGRSRGLPGRPQARADALDRVLGGRDLTSRASRRDSPPASLRRSENAPARLLRSVAPPRTVRAARSPPCMRAAPRGMVPPDRAARRGPWAGIAYCRWYFMPMWEGRKPIFW